MPPQQDHTEENADRPTARDRQEEELKMPLLSIIIRLLVSCIPGYIADKKGRSFTGYYLTGVLLSPLLSLIIALCVSDLYKREDKKPETPVQDHDDTEQ